MDKCRECPADRDTAVCGLKFYRYWSGSGLGGSYHTTPWFDASPDCHLTPSDMGAIGAAIRGEVYLMGIHPDIDRDSLGGMIAHALNL